MKLITTLFLSLYLLAGHTTLQAQTKNYGLPLGLKLETAEDCHAANNEFLQATDYLLSAPIDAPDRKRVNAFATVWMTNTPDVTVMIDINVLDALGKKDEGELMLLYMMGWSRYVLKTHDTIAMKGSLAGLHTVLDYYKDPAHKVHSSKKLDRLIKLDSEGKLEEELAAIMKKS